MIDFKKRISDFLEKKISLSRRQLIEIIGYALGLGALISALSNVAGIILVILALYPLFYQIARRL